MFETHIFVHPTIRNMAAPWSAMFRTSPYPFFVILNTQMFFSFSFLFWHWKYVEQICKLNVMDLIHSKHKTYLKRHVVILVIRYCRICGTDILWLMFSMQIRCYVNKHMMLLCLLYIYHKQQSFICTHYLLLGLQHISCSLYMHPGISV